MPPAAPCTWCTPPARSACRWCWAPRQYRKLKSSAASRRVTPSSSRTCGTQTRHPRSPLQTEGSTMLKMQDVSKIYRTDLIETYALRSFSLQANAGEFMAVTGSSGSGKTTFLNVAGLLESLETGSYELDGSDVQRLSDDARSRLRNERIGFIFQSFNLIPDLNVHDNVDVPLRYRRLTSADRRERINSALDLVGLTSRARHMLEQINEMGTTILLVTHDPELARRAQRNVHLVDGQISDFRAYEPRNAGAEVARA